MNSFQTPASNVAASLLVPPGQYTRVNGLQSFSGSAVTILAPALGSMFFAVIFVTLLAFIKIPDVKGSAGEIPGAFFEKIRRFCISFLFCRCQLSHKIRQ